MTVAFDISKFDLFRDGDLFYPGVASLLAIIHCGGRVVLYNSQGTTTRQEKKLIDKLTTTFGGKIIYAHDDSNADMSIN
ncbi:MAG: hypothetical protein ABIE07_09450 [Candidatus Zixiibacteriota bacterium]